MGVAGKLTGMRSIGLRAYLAFFLGFFHRQEEHHHKAFKFSYLEVGTWKMRLVYKLYVYRSLLSGVGPLYAFCRSLPLLALSFSAANLIWLYQPTTPSPYYPILEPDPFRIYVKFRLVDSISHKGTRSWGSAGRRWVLS